MINLHHQMTEKQVFEIEKPLEEVWEDCQSAFADGYLFDVRAAVSALLKHANKALCDLDELSY